MKGSTDQGRPIRLGKTDHYAMFDRPHTMMKYRPTRDGEVRPTRKGEVFDLPGGQYRPTRVEMMKTDQNERCLTDRPEQEETKTRDAKVVQVEVRAQDPGPRWEPMSSLHDWALLRDVC